MKRRQVLALTGAASAGLAGCSGSGMPKDAVVRAVQQRIPEAAVVVPYKELPPSEQQVAQTAVEEEFYHACPELPESVSSFAERFDTQNGYLKYDGSGYALWIRIQDMVFVGSASAPDEDPSCGLL